jgi:hypothetical protein
MNNYGQGGNSQVTKLTVNYKKNKEHFLVSRL